jgi:hypothetical protein
MIEPNSCVLCKFWLGACKKGHVNKIASSDKCDEFEPRNLEKANAESLPGCIGNYGHPIKPNGPCQTCRSADLCLHHKQTAEFQTAFRRPTQ